MKLKTNLVFAVFVLFKACILFNPALAQASEASTSECSAPSAGNPCFGTGNNPGQSNSAANPINLSNGNKYQEEVDFDEDDTYSGLVFIRYYNSTQLTPSLMGQGWRHSYNRKLYWHGKRPQILLDDSTRILFEPLQNKIAKSRFDEYGTLTTVNLAGAMERLSWSKAGIDRKSVKDFFSKNYLTQLKGDLWLWQYPSGAIDVFNAHGNLVISQMPFSEAVFIEREIKTGPTYEAVLKVQNQNQQSVDFHYAILGQRARLSQIDTPAGSITFTHDIPRHSTETRLLSAKLLNEAKITYSHLNHDSDNELSPYLIERARHYLNRSEQPERDVSWTYDKWGRGTEVTFHRHEDLKHPLSMQFNYLKIPQSNGDTGITEVTQTSNDVTTLSRFHTIMLGSQYLLSRAEGATCFKCPTSGTELKYNEDGQVIGINGLTIRRRAKDNSIESIGVNHRGWPGLRIYYDKDGTPHGWSSLYTGKTFYEIDPDTLYPKYKNFANNTRMYSRLDKEKSVQRVRYGRALGSYDPTHSKSLLNKFVPVIYILNSLDDEKNLSIKRRTQSINYRTRRWWSNHKESRLNELFTPYRADNLVEHNLPEWGFLFYQYDDERNLKTIYWQPADAEKGAKWKVVYERINAHERKYGNDMHLKARKNPAFINNSIKVELFKEEDVASPYWQEIRYYHNNGYLAAEHHLSPSLDINTHRQYAFNNIGQLIAVDTTQHNDKVTATDFYAWQPGGASFAHQHQRKTIKQDEIDKEKTLITKNITRDKAGFIQSMDGMQLIYDEKNLLTEIKKDGDTLGSYLYDALNHRVRKKTAKGETQYYYLNQQLVAEAFIPASATDPNYGDYHLERSFISRRYIYDGFLPVAFIDYSKDINGQLYFIHSDGSGQPFLVTDEEQQVVWLANNEVFGKSQVIIEEIEFNLRMPGQYYDAESGLHQNIYRNYDPEVGHYLEPDPLGPISGNEIFGYANQNPRQFIDPLGLLMFVFDGTTNTPSSQTNAYKLGQLYDEGPTHYLEGIGTQEANNKVVDYFKNYQAEIASTHKQSESSMIQRMYALNLLEWEVPEFIPNMTSDKLFAGMAPYMLNMQWMQLIDEMIRITATGPLLDNTFHIDLSGFSRGAALASIFANKIDQYTRDGYFQYTAKWLPPGQQQIQACVDLRFVGLFDTVHQLGALGSNNSNFDYTVSPAWAVFAHAVALNEHRKIMPLTSFADANNLNVNEQGFLGSHSDIGGSIFSKDLLAETNPYKETYGDLGNIPLSWIYDLALQENIKLKPLDALTQWQLDTLKNPLLHLASQYEQDSTASSWLLLDRRIYSSTGKNLGLQSQSKQLGAKVREEHIQSVDFPLTSGTTSLLDNYQDGYPYGVVRAREYLDFLYSSIEWNSSLKTISQPQ